eukprot:1052661-Prymnesium_polylepis.1
MVQEGSRMVASQTTEQILHTKSARFENVCARSAAHLVRTASSAAKVAQTAGTVTVLGPEQLPRESGCYHHVTWSQIQDPFSVGVSVWQ